MLSHIRWEWFLSIQIMLYPVALLKIVEINSRVCQIITLLMFYFCFKFSIKCNNIHHIPLTEQGKVQQNRETSIIMSTFPSLMSISRYLSETGKMRPPMGQAQDLCPTLEHTPLYVDYLLSWRGTSKSQDLVGFCKFITDSLIDLVRLIALAQMLFSMLSSLI